MKLGGISGKSANGAIPSPLTTDGPLLPVTATAAAGAGCRYSDFFPSLWAQFSRGGGCVCLD